MKKCSAAESFNSKVQAIKSSARGQAVKSSARGFWSFVNYRLRILFYCKNSLSYPTARATKFPEEPCKAWRYQSFSASGEPFTGIVATHSGAGDATMHGKKWLLLAQENSTRGNM